MSSPIKKKKKMKFYFPISLQLQYVSVIEWPEIKDLPGIMIGLTKIKIKTSKEHTKYHYIQSISAVVIYWIQQWELKNQTIKFCTKNIGSNDS